MSSLLTPLWYCITNYRDGQTDDGRTISKHVVTFGHVVAVLDLAVRRSWGGARKWTVGLN